MELKKRREEEAYARASAEQLGVGKKSVFRDKDGKVIDVEAAREKAIADALAGDHHSSHVTRHTSHITHHTSHITHHTSHFPRPPPLKSA